MKKLIFLVLILPLFTSCDQGPSIQMKYFLTVCADEWQLENGSYNEDKARDIKEHLEDQYQIIIDKISVEYFAEFDVRPTCFGCSCTTGDVVELTINQEYELILEDLGFSPVE